MIKFEQVTRIKDEIRLPQRATSGSAGYDFFAPEKIQLLPNQITMVMTGVKCELPDGLFLLLTNRSSNPIKKSLVLMNGVGIVDSDYYNNKDNEGEIGFELCNISNEMVQIEKGEKIGQGIIISFMKIDGDNVEGVREGGFGSTGE